MELTRTARADHMELHASGRLDERWAGHLSDHLNDAIRDGAHRIRLNMSAVSYLSSAGIRVLVTFYKQLGEIGGSFSVVQPSEMVRKVLDLTRLTPMLLSGVLPEEAVEASAHAVSRVERDNAVFEILDRAVEGFDCRVIGDSSLLATGGYGKEHARMVTFGRDAAGIGLGAFGSGFEDCRGRYGEFLAVAGSAAYLPTDGSNVPDYLLAAQDFLPQVSMLYGLVCHGRFSTLVRFEARKERRVAGLGEIAAAALDCSEADSALIVMVAETAGLVGASLRRAPTEPVGGLFAHPGIRRWITFTSEPAFPGSLCLVVGVAATDAPSELNAMLRPLSKRGPLTGHFHAATFPYQPLRKGRIDLPGTVEALFARESVQGVLHLLSDERATSGSGESVFVRGACWVGPIRNIVREEI